MNSSTIPIQFSIDQILSLTQQLPKELKIKLMKEWTVELSLNLKTQDSSPNLKLEEFEEPFDLEKARLKQSDLTSLQDIWSDEISAEELTKLL